MKRISIMFVLISLFTLIGCSNNDQGETTVGSSPEEESSALVKEDLTLQLLKVDEEAGLTLDDNEFYQAVQMTIDAEPKMGESDDFSILPLNIVHFEDDRKGLLFLAINRLHKPIQNITFELTFGHQDGTYIFEKDQVNLTEDYIGVLEVDGAIPFFLDITDEEEIIFDTLTNENTFMEMNRFNADF